MVLGYRALRAVPPNYTQGVPPTASLARGHREALPAHVHSYGTPLPGSDIGMGHWAAVPMHGSWFTIPVFVTLQIRITTTYE